MRLGLDYDNTYNADPSFWRRFIMLARAAGHDIRIVTARDSRFDRTGAIREAEKFIQVIYTGGVAKRWFVEHFVPDFSPISVWIDDKPEAVLMNSQTSLADLADWRATRADGPHLEDAPCA